MVLNDVVVFSAHQHHDVNSGILPREPSPVFGRGGDTTCYCRFEYNFSWASPSFEGLGGLLTNFFWRDG